MTRTIRCGEIISCGAGFADLPQRGFFFQPRVARNELPWVPVKKMTNPIGVASVPDIPFVEGESVFFKERPKLVLKRNLRMVLRLVGDVGADIFQIR